MNLLNIVLFAQQTAEGGGKGSTVQTFIFLALIIVVFYFFMIRPQTKKNKEAQRFRENLKRGDKIITIGGIHGKILEIEGNTDINIGINGVFLLDCIKTIDSKYFIVGISGTSSPVTIIPEDDKNHISVVMPIHIKS